MEILITESVKFIGVSLSNKLLDKAYEVIGIDNLTGYYDVNLKLVGLEKFNEYILKK